MRRTLQQSGAVVIGAEPVVKRSGMISKAVSCLLGTAVALETL